MLCYVTKKFDRNVFFKVFFFEWPGKRNNGFLLSFCLCKTKNFFGRGKITKGKIDTNFEDLANLYKSVDDLCR